MKRRAGGVRIMSREELAEQKRRQSERRDRWAELKALATDEDIFGFYRAYADYLKWDKIHSRERWALWKMATVASEAIAAHKRKD